MTPIRLTAVLTHPVQYYAAWFRYIVAHCPELALRVVYATEPSAEQQGVGFGTPFTWDVPLRNGYTNLVVRPAREGERVDSEHFRGLDVQEIGEAVLATEPEVALVFGWYSITLVRAIRACRRAGIPVLVFSDSQDEHRGFWRDVLRHSRTRALLKSFAAYLAPGTRAREYLIARGAPPTRIFRMPHTVDMRLFNDGTEPLREPDAREALRRAWGARPDEFVVLFAGKLESKKRVQDLIDAAAMRKDVRVLVAGRGPLEQSLRERAGARGARVMFAGFLNQRDIVRAYAAADCLALPSDWHETWGLVVNEALAAGLPVIVSNRAGCAPDLVVPGETGEVFEAGDVGALATAIDRCRDIAGRAETADRCRAHVARFSHRDATAGLIGAAESVLPRAVSVVACLGGMVIVGGLERMTLEVLRVVRENQGRVHALLNDWENHRLSRSLEDIGASWVGIGYRFGLQRREWTAGYLVGLTADLLKTNWRLFRDARATRATHILVPDLITTVRNAPALSLLKRAGAQVLIRVGNAPTETPLYRRLWGLSARLADTIVCNSRHTADRLMLLGVPEHQLRVIYNAVGPGRIPAAPAAPKLASSVAASVGGPMPPEPGQRRCRQIAFVGQIIPEKGAHLAVAALRALIARGRDCSLLVVGDFTTWAPERYAAYRDDVLRASRDLQDAGRVTFIGFREDVPALLASSAVLCCPSLPEQYEGAPNVVLEAKQAGTPAVAFDYGPFRELIRHGVDGWLCPTISADSLADGLEHVLSNHASWMQMSQAATESAARFGRRRFAAEWWRVFDPASADA